MDKGEKVVTEFKTMVRPRPGWQLVWLAIGLAAFVLTSVEWALHT